MRWEDDLYTVFDLNEDADPRSVVRLVDRHRVLLEQALAEVPLSERAREIFGQAGFGLALSGRYEEAIMYTKACISNAPMLAMHWVELSRSALTFALFQLGREDEAWTEVQEYRARYPEERWAKDLEALLRTRRARRSAQRMLWIGVAVTGTSMLMRLMTFWSTVVIPLLGLVLVLTSVIMEASAKKKERALREALRVNSPLRVHR